MSNIVLDRDFNDAFARIIELRKKALNEEDFTPEDANDYKNIAELLGFKMLDEMSTEVLRLHGQTIEGHWGYCTVDAKTKAKLSSQFGEAFPRLLRNTQRRAGQGDPEQHAQLRGGQEVQLQGGAQGGGHTVQVDWTRHHRHRW